MTSTVSRRDYFAGIAMKLFMVEAHLISKEDELKLTIGEIVAKRAYEMADLMIQASKKDESRSKPISKELQTWFCNKCGGGDEYDGYVDCKDCSQSMPFHPLDGHGAAVLILNN